MKTKLITATVTRVASTLVSNINTGLLEPECRILFEGPPRPVALRRFIESNRLTLKIHANPDAVKWLCGEYVDAGVIFVYVNRTNCLKVEEPYSNLIVLEYDDLLYRSKHYHDTTRTIDHVLEYVVNEYNKVLPSDTITDECITHAKERILDMDQRYDVIKHLPFSCHDSYYHIHGNHRNRA